MTRRFTIKHKKSHTRRDFFKQRYKKLVFDVKSVLLSPYSEQMERLIYSALIVFFMLGCGSDDGGNNNGNNPNLTNPVIDINLDLNLPEYNPLNFPGETVIVPGQGIRGVVIYNLNNTTYLAFDLADPNHPPKECSRMTLEGIIATCPCTDDNNSYSLGLFGQHETDQNLFAMQQYQARRVGDKVIVSN